MRFEACFTYRHHVITFHIWFIFIFTFIVELAEEVECHNSVKIHYYSQESYSKHKLYRETCHEYMFQFHSVITDELAQFITLNMEKVSYGMFPKKGTKESSNDSFEIPPLLGSVDRLSGTVNCLHAKLHGKWSHKQYKI